MPLVDKHAPGNICWLELATTDPSAAKTFYNALFGWSARDVPTSAGLYIRFQLQGRPAGGCFTMNPEELARGIPTHWHPYVAVESADASAARVAELDGRVIEAPSDIPQAGRIALIRDPTGAFFSLFEPGQHAGLGIAGEPGAFCWADLITRDPERAKHFYSGLFGWQVTAGQNDDYLHIRNRETFIGGIPPVRFQGPNTVPHWLIYFSVVDVDQTAAKAQNLGGKVYTAPMDIEHVGRMAILGDPQGAAFAIFRETGAR